MAVSMGIVPSSALCEITFMIHGVFGALELAFTSVSVCAAPGAAHTAFTLLLLPDASNLAASAAEKQEFANFV
jgi:hypothetical protein